MATRANVTPEHNVFKPYDGDYANNMTLTAVVELNGNELRQEGYELAAFVGDECRGSVKLLWVAPLDRYVAFLTVVGAFQLGCPSLFRRFFPWRCCLMTL